MSTARRYLFMAMLLAGATAILAPRAALALTPACTGINNQASVSFDVGGVPQAAQNSNVSSFDVGIKVDLAVAAVDGANVTAYPGQGLSGTGAVLTFTVTNNGNLPQDYSLSALDKAITTASPFSGSDTFDAGIFAVYVEDTTNGGYQPLEDTATSISGLAPGASATVYIVTTIPAAQVSGDIDVFALNVQTRWATGGAAITAADHNSTKADAPGSGVCTGKTVDVVLGDAAGAAGDGDNAQDGAGSARDAYQVTAVTFNIQKSSTVISDPINGSAPYKPIPGAVIEYTIRVTYQAGASNVTSVSISDTVPANTAAQTNVYGGTGEVELTTYNDTGAVTTTTSVDQGSLTAWGTAAGQTITAACSGFTLDEVDDYCQIKFQVQIL